MSLPDQLHARVVVVDHESANVLLLERLLAREGYLEVVSCTDPREVTGHFASRRRAPASYIFCLPGPSAPPEFKKVF